jgi:hypothetical protein
LVAKPVFSIPFKKPTNFRRPTVGGERGKSCYTACIPPHAHLVKAVNNPTEGFEKKLQETIANRRNMGGQFSAEEMSTDPGSLPGQIKITITEPEETP